MKLFDVIECKIYPRIESFDGGKSEMQCEGVTKSFAKARRMLIASIKYDIEQLQTALNEAEKLDESQVTHRGYF